MKTTVYVGTSGYSYSDWVGPVYPTGTDRTSFLSCYARRFPAVELNFTYYRQPDAGLVSGMIERTPPGFMFSVKGHKTLTHVVPETWPDDASRFLDGIAPLVDAGRLGAVLLQFPYSFHYTRSNRIYLDRLCDRLDMLPLAVEFRNAAWNTNRVREGLKQRKVADTATDYPDLEGLPRPGASVTADLGYVRFHGRNRENWWTGTNASRYDYLYSDEEIDEWVQRIRTITARTRVLFAVFNNHWRGQAVTNARMLKKKLEVFSDLELPVLHPD